MVEGAVFGGRFEVVKQLGKGGMGEVFLVRDRQIEDRLVALKLVRAKWSRNKQFRELFFQEIDSAQKFVSPFVVQIRDCGQLPDGQLFFTMDHIDGESVSRMLRREKTLAPKHALEIARQLLLGLSSGHERGLIHRDVKPSNVMLAARTPKTNTNPYGVQVALLDFGLAALTETLEKGRGPGTPHYMSPEQASGERLDARSDLFAVGVLLYELISGARLFEGSSEAEITSSVIETDPTPLIENLDGLGKPIKKLLRRALQKEREKRFSSAADFVEAIEKCTAFRDSEGAPGWVGVLAGISTVAAVALGGLLVHEKGKSRTQETLATVDEGDTQGVISDLRQDITSRDARIKELEDERDVARQGIESLRTSKDAEITLLNSRIAALGLDVTSRDTSIKNLTAEVGRLNERVNDERDERQDTQLNKGDVVSLLLDELRWSISIIGTSVDDYGGRLGPVGDLFDDLMRDIESGTGLGSSQIQIARANGTIDDRTPGFAYLTRLEELAMEIDRFEATESSDDRSFGELSSLRDRWEELSAEASIAQFRGLAGSNSETAGRDSRWLGLRTLSQDELAEKLMQIVDPLGGDGAVDGDATVSDADVEVLEGEEAEELLADNKWVKRKRWLQDWIQNSNLGNLTDALYRAQNTPEQMNHRVDALRAALGRLKERLDTKSEKLGAIAAARASAIRDEGDLDEHAEDVIRFLETFGSSSQKHAGGLVSRLVARCESRAVVDGRLTTEGLPALPRQLTDVAELVLGDTQSVYRIADDATLERLRWLCAAYRWYVDQADDAPPQWLAAFQDRALRAPTEKIAEPWRAQLAFQFQVATCLKSVPSAPDAKLVFETSKSNGAPSGWWVYEVADDKNGETALMLEILNTDGSSKSRTPHAFREGADRGGDFIFDRQNLFSVRSLELEGARFEMWGKPAEASREAFVASKARAFRSMNTLTTLDRIVRTVYGTSWAPTDGYRCLVVEKDRRQFWVHPVLGVVRQELALVNADLIHLDV